MAANNVILDLLRFELRFLQDGGYGRSPHTPWKPTRIFEDSPTCLNFDDAAHPLSCSECILMQFVPTEKQQEGEPCRFIPITVKGETVDDLNRCRTQIETEEALQNWLLKVIHRIEEQEMSKQQSTNLVS